MRFSVLTPSRNYAQFLGAAITSVRSQGSFAEHIVFDANSSDGTAEVAADFSGPNLHFIQEPDHGQSDALNKALGRASGEAVGWLNADEFYLPGALAAVDAAFASHPDVDVVHGDTVFVDAEGTLLRLLPGYPLDVFVLRHRGCVLSSCSSFFRRSALPPAPWDPDLHLLMDWDLYLSILESGGKFLHLSQPLAGFRVHANQVTHALTERDTAEHLLVRRKHGIKPRSGRLLRPPADILHAIHKGHSGASARQKRVAELRGAPLLKEHRVDPETWRLVMDAYDKIGESS